MILGSLESKYMERDEISLETKEEAYGSMRFDYRRLESLFTMKEIAAAIKKEESGESLCILESSLNPPKEPR